MEKHFIAAGSVVGDAVQSGDIVAGKPRRVLRNRFEEFFASIYPSHGKRIQWESMKETRLRRLRRVWVAKSFGPAYALPTLYSKTVPGYHSMTSWRLSENNQETGVDMRQKPGRRTLAQTLCALAGQNVPLLSEGLFSDHGPARNKDFTQRFRMLRKSPFCRRRLLRQGHEKNHSVGLQKYFYTSSIRR